MSLKKITPQTLLINKLSRKNESSTPIGRRSFALKTTVCNKVVCGHRLLEVLSPTIGKT